MKKIFAFLFLSLALTACYDDYIKDFDYTSIYFPNTIDVRTVVVGEGLKVKIGAALGGVMANKTDRKVTFAIDNNLVTPATLLKFKSSSYGFIKSAVANVSSLSVLPSNYYSLSDNSTIVIKTGFHSGNVVLKVDSTAFLSDPATMNAKYVLPLTIQTADADTIIEPNKSAVIGIKYEAMLFGNYLHGGITTVKDASGNTISTIPYYTRRNQDDSKIWRLSTVSPNAVATNGFSDKTSTSKQELVLTLNGGNITLSSATGSTNTYTDDGENSYNQAKLLQNRKILLRYKYTSGGNTYYCQDTLTFRNRIRDGVNEWQDENPSHYTK